MSGGGGTSAQVASPDRKSEASTASSPHYSSCGESEFDRYCSANSMLGTPSICSSVAPSEFGVLRSSSFGLGDDFENFALDGNHKAASPKFQEDRKDKEIGDAHSLAIISYKNGDVCASSGFGATLEEEDGNSSRYEHSEGEDSMYNYGTDDEHRSNSYVPRKGETVIENPLLMSSSVAFGSNDWDDFERESDALSQPLEMSSAAAGKKVLESETFLQEDANGLAVFPTSGEPELLEEVKDISVATTYHEHTADKSVGNAENSEMYDETEKDVRDISVTNDRFQSFNDDMEYLDNCSITDVFAMEQDPLVEKASNFTESSMVRKHPPTESKEVMDLDKCKVLERQEVDRAELGPLSNRDHPQTTHNTSQKFQIPKTKTTTMSFTGTLDKCKACDKTVYVVDLLTLEGMPYHKACFKCSHCKGTLQMSSYSSMDGVLYCRPHFEQLFKESGDFKKNFQAKSVDKQNEQLV